MTQSKLLLMCLQLILKSGVCPQTTPQDWVKLLMFLHVKGWLYVFFEQDKLAFIGAAYCVTDGWDYDQMPEKEEGDNLYIPFIVSFSDDKQLPLKMIKKYLAKNPNVKRVVFFERNDDTRFKEFIRPQAEERNDVEIKDAEFAGNANIPV